MKKLFLYFFILISIFCLPFSFTKAGFLDWDLWLNLYQDIEKWMKDFEEKQYIYEIKWQKWWELSENLNKILKNKKIWDCLNKDLTQTDVEKIASWDYSSLKNKLKEECYDQEKQEFSQDLIVWITNEINKLKQHYKLIAEEKAKNIEKISRLWMYADWNKDNSPFDLIVDIQEIDKIIFKQETEYNSDEWNEYSESEYEDTTKYIDEPDPGAWWWWWNNWNSGSWANSWSWTNTNSGGINPWEIPSWWNNNSNNYLCVNNQKNSWLDKDSLNKLLGEKTSNNKNNKWKTGHKKTNKTNKIDKSKVPKLSDPNFSSKCAAIWWKDYIEENDNDSWECNDFFCITVDFITTNFNPLSYDYSIASRSIENILETAAKHLKKASWTSLAQHKMTTNNFEMSLRFPYLPDLFHFSTMLFWNSTPILDLEKEKTKDELKKEDRQFVEHLLEKKYAELWLDYDKQNSLKLFTYTEDKLKTMSKSAWNAITRPWELEKEYNSIRKIKTKVNDYSSELMSKKLNNKILSDFEKQFTELEQFTNELLELVTNSRILIKKMDKIPTYSW